MKTRGGFPPVGICGLFFIWFFIAMLANAPVSASDGSNPFVSDSDKKVKFNDERQVDLESESDFFSMFCWGQTGFGPLSLPSQSPFQSLRMGLIPTTPSTLSRNQWDLRVHANLANVWANEPKRYIIDYESLDAHLSLAYGLTGSMELELGYQDRSVLGGVLDGFISDFHEAFGIEQDGRDQAPNGEVRILIKDKNGNTLLSYEDRSGNYSRGVSMTFKHRLTCGGKFFPAVSYALSTRWEIEDAGIVDRDIPVDFGASLSVAKRFSSVYAYLSGGYFWYGGKRIQKVDLKETQLSGVGALEWRYQEDQALILQCMVSEGQAKNLGPFSDPSYELTLGWKYAMGLSTLLEIGLIENIIIWDNSPDFGVHVGVTHRF
ncbi:MAG: DUF3187 family protein [Thermodesulfobacteriota bacterium]